MKELRLPAIEKLGIYLVVVYIIGIIGILNPYLRSWFIFLVPINILAAVIISVVYNPLPNKTFVGLLLCLYILGFLIEWIGVSTGVIFGSYQYGTSLGWRIGGVPIIMGLNWLLLVYATSVIGSRLSNNKLLAAFLGGLLMLLYDLFLEPSAIRYNFWSWENNEVPLQNYIAWFITGFVFCYACLMVLRKKLTNPIAEIIYWIQLGFFACLYLANN